MKPRHQPVLDVEPRGTDVQMIIRDGHVHHLTMTAAAFVTSFRHENADQWGVIS